MVQKTRSRHEAICDTTKYHSFHMILPNITCFYYENKIFLCKGGIRLLITTRAIMTVCETRAFRAPKKTMALFCAREYLPGPWPSAYTEIRSWDFAWITPSANHDAIALAAHCVFTPTLGVSRWQGAWLMEKDARRFAAPNRPIRSMPYFSLRASRFFCSPSAKPTHRTFYIGWFVLVMAAAGARLLRRTG